MMNRINTERANYESNVREQALRTLRELANALSVAVDALSEPNLSDLYQPTDFYEEVKNFEISLIKRALKKTHGNQTKAARLLGLNQPTLHGKIKQYRIYSEINAFREVVEDDLEKREF